MPSKPNARSQRLQPDDTTGGGQVREALHEVLQDFLN
jgi:hypothetical protein